MDFVIKPALQHISLAKITIELWIQNDYFMFQNEFKDELEAKVFTQAQNLPLPILLKKELEHFIKPIGLQIFEWFEYLDEYYHPVEINPKTVCWTSYGTFNKAKSVEVLLTDQSLNAELRFRLACDHCLVDEIESLWNELAEETKLQQEKKYSNHSLVQEYWINYLLGKPLDFHIRTRRDDEQNLSSNLYGCYRAMVSYNSTATKYFFGKLNSKEKESLLCDWRYVLDNCRSYTAETVRFLFSQMSKNQQAEILKTFPSSVIFCLLVWPYQRFFLETAKQAWEFLNNPACDFKTLLIRIIDKMVTCGHEYRAIFLEFWRSCPDTYKLKKRVIGPNIKFPWQQVYDCLQKGDDIFKKNLEVGPGQVRCWELSIGDMTAVLNVYLGYETEMFSISCLRNANRQSYSRSILKKC